MKEALSISCWSSIDIDDKASSDGLYLPEAFRRESNVSNPSLYQCINTTRHCQSYEDEPHPFIALQHDALSTFFLLTRNSR